MCAAILQWTPIEYNPNAELVKQATAQRLAFGNMLNKLGELGVNFAEKMGTQATDTLKNAKALDELYDDQYKNQVLARTSLWLGENRDAYEALNAQSGKSFEDMLAARATLNTLPGMTPEIYERLAPGLGKMFETGNTAQNDAAKRQEQLAAAQHSLASAESLRGQLPSNIRRNEAAAKRDEEAAETDRLTRPSIIAKHDAETDEIKARTQDYNDKHQEWLDRSEVRIAQNWQDLAKTKKQTLETEDQVRVLQQSRLTRDLLGKKEFTDAITAYHNGDMDANHLLAKVYELNPNARELVTNDEELNTLIKASERHDENEERAAAAAKVANDSAKAFLQASGRRRWNNPLLSWDSMFDPEDPLKGSINPLFEGQTGAEVTSAKRFASQEVGRLVNDIMKEHPEIGRDAEDKIMLANALLQTASNPQNKSKLAAALLKGTKLDQTFFDVGAAINLYNTHRGSKDLNAPFVRRVYGKDGLIDLDAKARELAIQDVRLRKSPNFQTAYAQHREALYTSFQENSGLNKDQLAYADKIWKALPNSGGTMPEFTPFVPSAAPSGLNNNTSEATVPTTQLYRDIVSKRRPVSDLTQSELKLASQNQKLPKDTREKVKKQFFINIASGKNLQSAIEDYLKLDSKNELFTDYQNAIISGLIPTTKYGVTQSYIQDRLNELQRQRALLQKEPISDDSLEQDKIYEEQINRLNFLLNQANSSRKGRF